MSGDSISGQVIGPDGTPVQGAIVKIVQQDPPPAETKVARQTTNSQGEYFFDETDVRGKGPWHVTARYEDNGQLFHDFSKPYIDADLLEEQAEAVNVDLLLNVSLTENASTAIPDSGMFQDPIYQFWAGDYSGSDGDSAFAFPEVLGGLSDASAVGGPSYRSDQAGFAAGEYDGSDDAHNVSTDSQMPSGSSPVSIAMLVYLRSTADQGLYEYGGTSDGERLVLRSRSDGKIQCDIRGTAFPNALGSTTYSTGQWITVGTSVDADTVRVYLNGGEDATESNSTVSLVDDNHGFAYRRVDGGEYLDGFVAEVIVSAANETEQAFTDYHTDRLG